MTARLREARLLERSLLKYYSAWQETHRIEFAERCMTLLGKILRINPHYSVQQSFRQAF